MYTAPIPVNEETDYHADLFMKLRALRKSIADENNVPPYVLFSDATLKELSRYFPLDKEAMLQIKGVGERKYEQYGEVFLEVIKDWRENNPDVKAKVRISDAPATTPRLKKTEDDRPSHMISYQMFQAGKYLKDIGGIREMSPQTIENHLFKGYKTGYPIAWEIFFNSEEEKTVLAARENSDEPQLKPL